VRTDALLLVQHRPLAGAFRACGTPAVMRLLKIMGMEQCGSWGVSSLNDFRRVRVVSSTIGLVVHLFWGPSSLVLRVRLCASFINSGKVQSPLAYANL
jgi:hypothetical protein